MTKSIKGGKVFWLIALHGLLLFYSLCGVFAKLAAKEAFMSLPFILFYGAEIFVLFVYAVLWQQILKHIPLTVAFCNKSVGMIWTMCWSIFLFKETFTPAMLVGAVIVLVGVFLVVSSHE